MGSPIPTGFEETENGHAGLSELLETEILSELLDSLFPRRDAPDPIEDWRNFIWMEDWEVQTDEMIQVIKKRAASNTKAPRPDGFRLTVWKSSPDIFMTSG